MRVVAIAMGITVLLGGALWLSGWLRQSQAIRQAVDRFWTRAIPARLIVGRGHGWADDVPLVVRRYLDRALPPGTTAWHQMELTQSGQMRVCPGKSWMPFKATQLVSALPPGFVWQADVRALPGLPFYALDSLDSCRGTFSGSVLGLMDVANGTGSETDVSTLLRYLAEAVWLPVALLPSGKLRWEATVDPLRARAVLTCGESEVSGMFTFDEQVRPVEFFTAERYRDIDGTPVRTPWRVEYSEHQRIEGIEIPRKGTVSWLPPEGPFEAMHLTIDEAVPRCNYSLI